MKFSKLLVNTLRDNPSEAEVVSHQLLLRAGYIRRLASGIYNYLPLMQRVLKKVEHIVREEMDRAGAQELLMPILQPSEIWQESGRFEKYGPELVRLKDRHERDFVLAPTHEEVITGIAKSELKSYRQLPVNLYQIQNKYRDERRPRFGLLRGREFIMKDAYSFHATEDCLNFEYFKMKEAYFKIFSRCGLQTRMVRSDSGAIGGSESHEFMVLTRPAEGEQESGENDVFYSTESDYAANANHAESILPPALTDGSDLFPTQQEVETPNCDSIEKLSAFLKAPASLICKALLYIKDEKEPFLVLIRGDVEAEEAKIINVLDASEIRMATSEEITRLTGSEKGFVGIGELHLIINTTLKKLTVDVPGNLKTTVLMDKSVVNLKNFIIAFNKPGYHLVGHNWHSEQSQEEYAVDVRRAKVGDTSPDGHGTLQMTRGIEVGNIFKLGTKYSETMSATFTDEDGTEKPFIMGCYGIGVSRVAASAIERYHDANGIIWPPSIAPYQVIVVPANSNDELQRNTAEQVYVQLQQAGLEAVLDDRDERAGVKFKDADLIGFPVRVTIGKKLGDGLLEVKRRDQALFHDVPIGDVIPFVQHALQTWQEDLEME